MEDFGSIYLATWLDYIYEYNKNGTWYKPAKVALKTLNIQDKLTVNAYNEVNFESDFELYLLHL